jgi:hypothetical protein
MNILREVKNDTADSEERKQDNQKTIKGKLTIKSKDGKTDEADFEGEIKETPSIPAGRGLLLG